MLLYVSTPNKEEHSWLPEKDGYKRTQRCIAMSINLNHEILKVEIMKPSDKSKECHYCRLQYHTETKTSRTAGECAAIDVSLGLPAELPPFLNGK
jgi:hypothetical protein